MSEEVKIQRLGKAAKEFNVATATIVEFLSKKGFTVEDNINTKLTAEMYQLVVVEYQYEKNIKEEAQKLEIGTTKHAVIELKSEEKKIEKPNVEIKKQIPKTEKPSPAPALKIKKEISKTEILKDKVAKTDILEKEDSKSEIIENEDFDIEIPKPEIAETEILEDEIAENEILESEIWEDTEEEDDDEILSEEVPPSDLEESAPTRAKIVGKVDLSTLNEKLRPAKKTREEKRKEAKRKEIEKREQEEARKEKIREKEKKERAERKKAEKERAEKQRIEREKKAAEKLLALKKAEAEKAEKAKQTVKEEVAPVPVPEKKPPEKKEPEMIKAEVPTIIPPKVIGVLDLSSINEKTKPKRRSREELRKQNEERTQAEKALREARRDARWKQEAARRKALAQQKEKEKEKRQEKEKDNNQRKERDRKPEKKGGDFIPTKVDKLSGVKVVDKINLSGDRKDSKPQTDANQGDKREKRKRFKTVTSGSKFSKFREDLDKKRRDRKDEGSGRRTEISEEEVDFQIKKTMARMAPTGKTKTSKYRREKRDLIQQNIEQAQERQAQERNILKVTEFITANELASMMNVPVNKVIATCMSIGLMVAINQRLDTENIQLLAEEFGYQVQFVGIEEEEIKQEETNPEDLEPRSPIVTVMGHVDHGKTSLLDYIRKTNVIAGEAGGITQHIGAYEVELPDKRRITFLDTPGHEAFTAMRARGAKVTDIVIVVIAADDSIMPQTIEAINHAQAAGVPIIFAINKIDKPGADPEKIRNALANMNLLVEEWGGKIQSQDISAKKGINVDVLMEKILIEAEMLELKANPKIHASGTILESSLDKGRGYVAKALIQNGTLHKGDVVAAGTSYGKIKAMYNERNHLIASAGPAAPVLLLGLDSAPQAGDTFKVYENDKEAKNIVSKRQQLIREQGLRTQKHITLTEIGRRIAIGDFKELNIIVKGDVDGSIEALSDALLRLTTEEVQVNVIHKSVGQVTESDILLASASNAIIIAFQVRPSAGARKLAEQEQVDIRTYSIIYDAINDLKEAIEGMKAPEIKENIVCNIEVREVFHISKVGVIAGCYVLDGKVQRSTQVRVIRDGIVVFTGRLGSLKRFKDDVKEVTANYECGLNIESYNDIKVGDIIEGFEQVEVKR